MQIEQRIVGNVAIVTVNGEITLRQGGDVLLKDKVQSLLHQGYTNLLLDLSGVSCEDCVLPPDQLHDTIAAAISRRVPGEFELVVADPRR